MKYRTKEQFIDICEDMVNGNWTNAGENCAKYGFWAGDLRKAQEELEAEEMALVDDKMDFVELIEIASKYRKA